MDYYGLIGNWLDYAPYDSGMRSFSVWDGRVLPGDVPQHSQWTWNCPPCFSPSSETLSPFCVKEMFIKFSFLLPPDCTSPRLPEIASPAHFGRLWKCSPHSSSPINVSSSAINGSPHSPLWPTQIFRSFQTSVRRFNIGWRPFCLTKYSISN